MSMLGGAARTVIDDIKSPISFAPDGKRFVYESCWSEGVQFRVARVDRDDDRQLANIRKAQCGVFQVGPSWSRDGRTIVAPVVLIDDRSLERTALASVAADDGTVRELYSAPYVFGRPIWLPGGHSLLVPHSEEGFKELQLWTVTFPGGEARRLTDDLTWYGTVVSGLGAGGLDATPDGRTAVSIVSTRISNIWAVPIEHPMEARQVSNGLPVAQAQELANGRILAVDREGKLWTMDQNGSHRTSFTSLRDVNTFSRCGNVVLAQVDPSSQTMSLFRVDAEGSHATPLIEDIAWAPYACSDKGDYVFYANKDAILRIPMAGGPPREVGHHLGCIGWPGVSPDGARLACVQSMEGTAKGFKVTVVGAHNGSAIASWPVQWPSWGTFQWSPHGVAWWFLRSDGGVFNVWEQPFGGGSATQLTSFTSGRIFNFNRSLDGKRLVVTRGNLSHDVVLLTFK